MNFNKERIKTRIYFLFIIILFIITKPILGQLNPDAMGRVYVTVNGNGDGSSWGSATNDIQAAINTNGANRVYVAIGTYNLSSSITMRNNIEIYGGFDPLNNITNLTHARILPDAINNQGSILKGNNSFSIILNNQNNLNSSAILDGFTLTEGNGSGFKDFGGGIFNHQSSPSYNNLLIKNNFARIGGGGVYNRISTSIYTNIIIVNNHSNYYGGGIANSLSSPKFINSIISNNNADSFGGGVYNGQSCSPEFINVKITDNSAGQEGGGIDYWINGTTTLKNVTIAGNTPDAFSARNTGAVDFVFHNSIIFGNIRQHTYAAQNSFIEGENDISNGNINATGFTITDIFTNPSSENYTLKQGSPAVNAGSNGLYPGLNASTKDLLGNPRVHQYFLGGSIDIGAYESTYNPTVVPGAFGVAYVRTSYYGNGNGSSWENATISLQDAISATGVTHVFVEKGTYAVPSPHSFIMKNGVKIYGGFDPQNNIKTLSDTRIMPAKGNQGSILDGKNERPVIWNDFEGAPALTGTSVLDGFTITRASGTNQGSIYNKNASPTLKNLLIHGNNTAGIYNAKGSPTVSNVAIVKNTGMGVQQMEGNVTLNNTTIAENGAAIFVNQANALVAINNSIVFGGVYGFTGSNISSQYSFVESPQIQNSTNVSSAGYSVEDIFTNPDGLDFSPKLNTPVINKANQSLFPDNAAISKDLAGNPRLSGIKMDIGAYENIDGPMPVVFSSFSAFIKNGKLYVNWATESESNNDHFLVQVSADGQNWRTVETVASKAVDGNSSEGITYSISIPTSAAMAVMGFFLIMVAPFSARRRSLLAIAILSVIIVGCNKNELVKSIDINKLFVRVVQVDKDGTEKVSKIISVTNN